MRVRWTDKARAHLRAIHDYIARDSKHYAKVMVDRITTRTKALGKFPGIGHSIPEIDSFEIRQVLEGPYRIVYRVRDNKVEIAAVIHSARDWNASHDLSDGDEN